MQFLKRIWTEIRHGENIDLYAYRALSTRAEGEVVLEDR